MITIKEAANIFYHHYDRYKEQSLKHKRIRHSDIVPLIHQLTQNKRFVINDIGQSVQERNIFLITAGHGKNKIFMWSQMHGDESTATMAIFDLLNFLSADDEFNELRQKVFETNTIHILPMLNPDGAELYQRRNAMEIDLNRDAVALQSPEAVLLNKVFELIKPHIGFNLHDQSERYSVGNSHRQASISFLAPASDNAKSITPNRKTAMQIIVELNSAISEIIPGHTAKYSDEFEPRAFGDNFQKREASTVLIESGGWKGDSEKQFLRKINFVLFLSAFESITAQSYKSIDILNYERIPENQKFIMDLILRNLTFSHGDRKVKIDVGINREELTHSDGTVYFKSLIEDVGDLSTFYGIEEYDLNGFEAFPGKIHKTIFSSFKKLQNIDSESMIRKGVTDVCVSIKQDLKEFTTVPYNLRRHFSNEILLTNTIKPGEHADLFITRNGKVSYTIVNGFLYNIFTQSGNIVNGIVK